MHIVSVKTLREFWKKHSDAQDALKAWYYEAKGASWTSFADIKQCFGSADCLPENRVVFNIKGNRNRLVVKIHYDSGRLFIRFVGTHAEYDKIDATTI